eukprot:CAMPEP_0206266858 /NCGR_PEP_ID=MMETSP0047_2-20121206/30822_1 /ASSEMBLY_ACC=CAM_ASM_000192 /TAXON_ID=195065 /ORGANISM="Chroomonas mesostigmatica_cf, Strain CCMP1168" /LENGTH=58 /DNA_ID=CAMNT_0053694987 /DNA_START=84 /DNA_END=257 /DNA_ORIENTATION=-
MKGFSVKSMKASLGFKSTPATPVGAADSVTTPISHGDGQRGSGMWEDDSELLSEPQAA